VATFRELNWFSTLLLHAYLYSIQAYHDVATHNITDGTGGLDGSIFFELNRAEVRHNVFDAFFLLLIGFPECWRWHA